ncbi:NAD(P)-dependent dehydrogenase (short-subunit alcohol dehydrogenase family) [Allocatelliglobosispora scoriae]|uniref:NAD(P)-dependent dehydrogenase (Short-subunit alcohol dehydrogenase family) n=1 Tax=Allocatelliglobosispora scoriae TaxID=643052 RepID=A0A841BNW7_9ACTN|nr:SDR family NAD(P)-dependent oxidoreductase [Allocatelliglobosispora scoriae]MBB5868500.1 NAD(P)-dependent dehydrogenase (short-subunit alcohol dehydrogenase family) [Allocatelliglobosispora scoriae]
MTSTPEKPEPRSDRHLLAAEGAHEIMALLSGQQSSLEIRRRASATQPYSLLRMTRTAPAPPEPGPAPPAAKDPDAMRRHLYRYVPAPGADGGEGTEFAAPGTLVVLGAGIDAAALPLREDTGLLIAGTGGWTLNGRPVTAEQTDLRNVLTGLGYRHVRAVVDLGDAGSWLAEGPAGVLAVHDAMLPAAQGAAAALADGGTFHVLALRGADRHGVPHPYAGLFTGFVKALEVEPSVTASDTRPGIGCIALLTSAADLPTALAQLRHESGRDRVLPAVMYAGDQRRIPSLLLSPAHPGPQDGLSESSVVVGAGASRGIGMAMLRGIAERHRPQIHVIGSNDLSAYDPAALTEPPEAFRLRRTAHLRQAGPGRTVAELNADMNRLAQARRVHADMLALRELCGHDRVHYHVCDVTDGAAVQAAAERILRAAGGSVDLLLNVAGVFRPAELSGAGIEGFRTTRDIKVAAYRHLKNAFGPQVRRWINTSSISAVYGLPGETAYSSANDFLLTAGAHAHHHGGGRETSIGWGLWSEAGIGADPTVAATLAGNGDLTPMLTAEGLRHLFAELAQDPAAVSPVLVGGGETQAMSRYRPRIADLWARQPDGFFLDEPAEVTETRLVAYREFSGDRDGYLHDHTINGHPTLPGLMYLEIGAQAACRLVAARVPVAVEDLVLARFLRLYDGGGPQRKKITAELLRHDPSPHGESEVLVTVTTDLITPNGTVLGRDRLHARLRVLLRDRPRHPSRLPAGHRPRGGRQVRNPYQIDSPFARLDGVFGAAAQVDVGPHGNTAAMRLDADRTARWFHDGRTPAIACDAAAQISIAGDEDGWSTVAVPLRIARVDFYGGATDGRLADARTELTLLSEPARRDRNRIRVPWSAVVGDDGRLAARISGLTAEIIGYVHQSTGQFREAEPDPADDAPSAQQPTGGPEDEPAVRAHLVCYATADYTRPVDRFAVFAEPAALPPTAGEYLPGRAVLLIGAHPPLLAKVGRRLTEAGVAVTTAATVRQLDGVAATAAAWDAIIDLNLTGLADYTLGDPSWERALELTTSALQLVYPAWAAETDFHRRCYLVVTCRDGMLGRSGEGRSGTRQPLAGAWSGLAKTVPMELPAAASKVIDLDTHDDAFVTQTLLAEAGQWDDQEVGYRHRRRYRFPLRRHPLPPPVDGPGIGPGDCVLISGGGRGIGWRLATALARTGAKVVVTGRQRLPAGPDAPPWLSMTAEQFLAWRAQHLRDGAAAGAVKDALTEAARAEEVRALRANLAEAAAAGLDLRYHACDITDPRQVADLAQALTTSPTVLVHNAGVYRGARLSAYTPDEVRRTVAVKVTGLAHLLAAFRDGPDGRPSLRMLCNVSSMSAKVGGMVGQAAYAAANEALGQLGAWAARRYRLPVHTVCWNTWERTGNIVNYIGAAQYGSTIDPAEGIRRWTAELAALAARAHPAGGAQPPRATESVYYGRFGVVAPPGWLAALPWPPDHRDTRRLRDLLAMAGQVREFSSHRRLAFEHRFSHDQEPTAGQSEVSLPVMLEYALGAGDWLPPEGRPRQHLLDITEISCDPGALGLGPGRDLRLTFHATGRWEERDRGSGDCWNVRVVARGEDGRAALSCVLRYASAPPDLPRPANATAAQAVARHHDAELWDSGHAPRMCLPHPGLDALLAAARTGPRDRGRWLISRLAARPGCLAADRLLTLCGSGGDYALAAGSEVVLVAESVRWNESAEQGDESIA